MVSLSIDGRKVQVPKDTSVLVAARTVGIKIPTLCYHPKLSSYGGCRLCIVQIKGLPRPVTSCTTLVEEGMEVVTSSPEIESLRRTYLELILANHPVECPKCEQAGNCTLQDIAYLYGGFENRFKGRVPDIKVKDDNPFIRRDMEKCILCGRCVRVCHEIQGVGAIDFTFRGFKSKIDTAFSRQLQCEYCGQCISVCPTGALTGRIWEFKGWQQETTDTVCPYCGVGCNITLHVKGKEIIRVTSKETSWNEGLLCVKGRFGYRFVNSPERLKRPLMRVKDKGQLELNTLLTMPYHERLAHFKEVSWSEAVDFIATKLREIKSLHGAYSIGGLSSARCTNEENYLFQKFMRCAIGTNNIDQNIRFSHASSIEALSKVFGSGAMTNSIEEIDDLDVIFIIGSNTKETHPVIANRMIKAYRKGAKIVVADPRRVSMVRFAEFFLNHRPNTDVALLNAMAKVILEEGLYNREFVESKTEGLDDYAKHLRNYSLEQAESITGVKKQDIIRASRLYGSAKNGGIFFSVGLTQQTSGMDNVYALSNLVLLTGNIGRKSTGIYPLRGQNNTQGATDAGCIPNMLPGYQKVTNPALRAKFEYLWQCQIPSQPGMTAIEMFESAHSGGLKALYVMGENPLLSNPDTQHAFEALKKLDLLVVQDLFLTETALLADVILPSGSFAEKDGTFTNTDRRVQRVKKALTPLGDAKPDLQIIMMLSNAMGYPMNYKTAAEVWSEYGRLWPAIAGITYSRIDKKGLHWPCPTKDHPGTRFLYQGGFPKGKLAFTVVNPEPTEIADRSYPFTLTTGRNLYNYHTDLLTSKDKAVEAVAGIPYVEMNKKDLKELGVEEGDLVKVTSKRGSLTLKAKVTDAVPERTIFIPIHYAGACANLLTARDYERVSKTPQYKLTSVNVEKLSAPIDKDELIRQLQQEVERLRAEIKRLKEGQTV